MVHRVAVVDKELCQSKKCGLECIRECPVNINGQECIVLGDNAKAVISEELCIGCGICIKVCPFDAIEIVNLAEELKEDKIHQFGVNSFRLYRIPIVRRGHVIGLVGRNGIGKTTALKIISGSLIPNLGDYEHEPSWDRLIEYLSGREMKEHFVKIASNQIRVSIKPQAVYMIPKLWKKDTLSLLKKMDEIGKLDEVVEQLNLGESLHKEVKELSGGELQRVAVAVAALKDADLYLFDEPSSYNDVYQRLAVSKLIRSIAERGKAVMVVEHDIAFLDYVTDYVQVIYGEPGVYGIVSGLYSSRTGINALLDGYLPQENVRFRESPVIFSQRSLVEEIESEQLIASYTDLTKKFDRFTLNVKGGNLKRGSIIGVVGANALGKTTFLRIIAGELRPDNGEVYLNAKVSYKPQYLKAEYEGTVGEFFSNILGKRFDDPLIQDELVRPLRMEKLFPRRLSELSGGELQKVAIISTLAQDAEIYALDEPSAFLDVEDRFIVARAINRIVKSGACAAIVIDHDIQVIDLVSDSIMVFYGERGVNGYATTTLKKEDGMNLFLSQIGLTYRRDVNTGRPRVNKPGSKLDREQKERGQYYYLTAKIDEDERHS